jgi:hypothetical protein
VRADVKLHGLFTDNMILQRDASAHGVGLMKNWSPSISRPESFD